MYTYQRLFIYRRGKRRAYIRWGQQPCVQSTRIGLYSRSFFRRHRDECFAGGAGFSAARARARLDECRRNDGEIVEGEK